MTYSTCVYFAVFLLGRVFVGIELVGVRAVGVSVDRLARYGSFGFGLLCFSYLTKITSTVLNLVCPRTTPLTQPPNISPNHA